MSTVRTVEIETTPDDINNGDDSYENNPIALAARRQIPEVEGVTCSGLMRLKKKRPWHYQQVIPVPTQAGSEPTKFNVMIRNEV
jgi:hypothetical protein